MDYKVLKISYTNPRHDGKEIVYFQAPVKIIAFYLKDMDEVTFIFDSVNKVQLNLKCYESEKIDIDVALLYQFLNGGIEKSIAIGGKAEIILWKLL